MRRRVVALAVAGLLALRVGGSHDPRRPDRAETVADSAYRLGNVVAGNLLVIVGVLAMRNHAHFAGPPADYQSWSYATDAAAALA